MSIKRSQKNVKDNFNKYFNDNYPGVRKTQQDTFISLNKNIFRDFFQYTYGQLYDIEHEEGVPIEGYCVERTLFGGKINLNGKQVLISVKKYKLIDKNKKTIIKFGLFIWQLLFDIFVFLLSAGKSNGDTIVSGDTKTFILIGVNRDDFRNKKDKNILIDKNHIFLVNPLKTNFIMMSKTGHIKTFKQIEKMLNFMTDDLQ